MSVYIQLSVHENVQVWLYRDKVTNALKGDCTVTYEVCLRGVMKTWLAWVDALRKAMCCSESSHDCAVALDTGPVLSVICCVMVQWQGI